MQSEVACLMMLKCWILKFDDVEVLHKMYIIYLNKDKKYLKIFFEKKLYFLFSLYTFALLISTVLEISKILNELSTNDCFFPHGLTAIFEVRTLFFVPSYPSRRVADFAHDTNINVGELITISDHWWLCHWCMWFMHF